MDIALSDDESPQTSKVTSQKDVKKTQPAKSKKPQNSDSDSDDDDAGNPSGGAAGTEKKKRKRRKKSTATATAASSSDSKPAPAPAAASSTPASSSSSVPQQFVIPVTSERFVPQAQKAAAAAPAKSNKRKKEDDDDVDQKKDDSDSDSDDEGDESGQKADGEKKKRKRKKRKAASGEAVPVESEKEEATASSTDKKNKFDKSASNKKGNAGGEKKRFVVFVGNLDFRTTVDAIKAHFGGDEGGVTGVRMSTDKVTNKPKGFAFVEFKDADGLQAAIKKHHTPLNKRKINVELTAGGGGSKSVTRKNKLAEKNKKLEAEREELNKKRRDKEAETARDSLAGAPTAFSNPHNRPAAADSKDVKKEK